MHSCLYEGWVRHRRLDRPHEFRYRLYMTYLDLEELDEVFARRWFWSTGRWAPVRFRRTDYLGDPSIPLADAVRDRVQDEFGVRPKGPIRMLTHLSHFGYVF